jgi:S-adenosylmethionine:tRNA-ribosyltransferase-isomerase (queuine synthetase)
MEYREYFAGYGKTMQAYRHAIIRDFCFYSYGDATFVK